MDLADWSAGVLPDQVKSVLPDPGSLEKVYTKRRDSFHTAPGYRELAVEYTCIPDSMYPWNPEVMQAIRVFAPDAVPLWVRWVFRTPQDYEDPHDKVFGRHALGRSVDNLESDLEPLTVTMPSMPCQGLTFPKPNRLWFIHEGEREENIELPGAFLPFDATIYLQAEEAARGFRMTDQEYKAHLRDVMINQPMERREARKRANEDDMEERSKDFHKYADKIIETVSDVEIGEFSRRAGDRR